MEVGRREKCLSSTFSPYEKKLKQCKRLIPVLVGTLEECGGMLHPILYEALICNDLKGIMHQTTHEIAKFPLL